MGMLVATAREQFNVELFLSKAISSFPFFDQKSVADFTFKGRIGSGATSEVYLVSERASGRAYALKKLRRNFEGCFARRSAVQSESQIYKRVNSPFLVNAYSCFTDESALYLQLPYAPFGDLRSQLIALERLPEKVAIALAAEILLGLESLHGKGIVHCDLKPENVLISSEGRALISDFGMCQQAKQARRCCGTPAYMSPEVILCREAPAFPFARDVWAFGVLLYELLDGCSPFSSSNYYQAYKNVIGGKWQRSENISDNAFTLLCELLSPDVEKRPSLAEVRGHAFFAGVDWEGLRKGQCPDLASFFVLVDVRN